MLMKAVGATHACMWTITSRATSTDKVQAASEHIVAGSGNTSRLPSEHGKGSPYKRAGSKNPLQTTGTGTIGEEEPNFRPWPQGSTVFSLGLQLFAECLVNKILNKANDLHYIVVNARQPT